MKRKILVNLLLILGLAILGLALVLLGPEKLMPTSVQAQSPEVKIMPLGDSITNRPTHSLAQNDGRPVSLTSTDVECLNVAAGRPESVSATVRLEWQGEVEEAFLVLAAAGSEEGHSIYVNGWRVGAVSTQPGDQICRTGNPMNFLAPTDTIPLPIEILNNGENTITLTNDANVNDSWTAADVHLNIHGVLSGPPVVLEQVETPLLAPSSLGLVATGTATQVNDFPLPVSYPHPSGFPTQNISYQIPMSYTPGISVPLLIAVHGMGGTGLGIKDLLAPEANNRGWLLAAPDMRGWASPDNGRTALAWVGAQHDIIDTIEYMMTNSSVDPSRIYIVGESMGGQTTTVMITKYPDIFAASAEWMGYTDLTQWRDDLQANFTSDWPADIPAIIADETSGPETVTFEYERRSPITMALNAWLVPFQMWHNVPDQVVLLHHAHEFETAINSSTPPTPVVVNEVSKCYVSWPPYNDPTFNFGHCYKPPDFPIIVDNQVIDRSEDNKEMFDFLYSHTLSSQPPPSLIIRTDESKPYYWLKVTQTGRDHWSEIEASYDLGSRTVMAVISDTNPLTLAFNLGPAPIAGTAGISQAGMGLPATTYLVTEEGDSVFSYEQIYTSGYFTVTLNNTGQVSLTISATSGIIVTSNSGGTGGPDCTLRDAITAANTDTATGGCPAGNGADTILLQAAGPYILTAVDNYSTDGPNGLPSITSEIIINGNGATIERPLVGTPNFRIFHVAAGGELMLQNGLTVRGGDKIADGGGIFNAGGKILLLNSTVSGNATIASGKGGGIFNDGGIVNLDHSTVSGNFTHEGGGICTIHGTVTLINSTVSDNLAKEGGGVLSRSSILALTNSTVNGNHANYGGGILNRESVVTLTNSTVSGNWATDKGGGIYSGALEDKHSSVKLINSTVSDNNAGGEGGGIFSSANPNNIVELFNTVVAKNPTGNDCYGKTIVSNGYNLDSDDTCNLTATGDITNTNPLIDELKDHGGPTLTHGLTEDSPAIDQIPEGTNGCGHPPLDTDQRGVQRPQLAACDIGAFERQFEEPTVIDLLTFIAQPGPDHVTLTWQTGTEMDNAGFNLHRATAAAGPYTKLNDALILAKGDAHSGASYAYTDNNVVKGETYYYKLEDVDIHGVSTFHGPVSATPGVQADYLPLILK